MFLSLLGWELDVVGPKTEHQERNNSEGIIASYPGSPQATSLRDYLVMKETTCMFPWPHL